MLQGPTGPCCRPWGAAEEGRRPGAVGLLAGHLEAPSRMQLQKAQWLITGWVGGAWEAG